MLDNLMTEGGEDKEFLDLFTKHSHHQNITVLYLCQDMFPPGKYAKSISRNAQYVIAFKNPRDQLGIRNLLLQAFPTYWKDMMDVYQKVTDRPFRYMVPDLHPASDDRIRVFLSGRSQRVKLGKDCVSEWGTVPSGVPQGTKLGPWLFLLMINDLTVPSIFDMWKYVDDTTVSENIPKGQQSKSQEAVDAIYDWSKENLFQLNGEKTKELVISFSRDSPQFPGVCIDGTPIKTIKSTKLLGLTINDTLTWNDHIEELVKKASKKLYFLIQLKRAHVPTSDLVTYFCACIRSSLDYACPVFHYSLPMYLQVELERVQRRALSCIFPRVHYSDALQLAGLQSIRAHQEKLTEHLFKSIVNDPRSKITSLLPPAVSISHELRRQRRFATPLVKTNRFANSFIVKSAREAFK